MIAEHVNVSIVDLTPATPTVPDDARRFSRAGGGQPGEYTVSYIFTPEAWYAEGLQAQKRNDILVTAEISDGSPGTWEFLISQHDFRDRSSIRVGVFAESFEAFTVFGDFFAALATERVTTLDQARRVLDQVGAWDATPRFPEG